MKRLCLALLLLLGVAGCHSSVANLGKQAGPIVVLGDSLSFGTGSETRQGYVAILEARTKAKLINKGVPGDTTGRALLRFQRDVLDLKPSLLILELGGNDFLQKVDMDEIFANLDKMIVQVQAQGGAVLLLGVQGGIFSDKAATRYSELAKARQTGFVPNIMDGIMSNPALKTDALHPNDAGYAKLADRVEPELRWCLSRLKT